MDKTIRPGYREWLHAEHQLCYMCRIDVQDRVCSAKTRIEMVNMYADI